MSAGLSRLLCCSALSAALQWNLGVILLGYWSLLAGKTCVPTPSAAPFLLPGISNRVANLAAGITWALLTAGLVAALLAAGLPAIG